MWIIVTFAFVMLFIAVAASKHAEKEQTPANVKPTQNQPVTNTVETSDDSDENDSDDTPSPIDYETYEKKKKEILKEMEKLFISSVTSDEMSRSEKVSIMNQVLSSVEENVPEDETRFHRTVIRKLYKYLVDHTSNFTRLATYNSEYEDIKEESKDKDYLALDDDWEKILDYFDEFNEEKVELKDEKPSVAVAEKRSEELNGTECEVLNFAVKGLFFRTKEDQKAACTLAVGDPLHMEFEPDNERDPNAMKVTMLDGHHIGYVDGKFSAYVKENVGNLQKFVVSKITDDDIPFIYAEAFFKKD